MWTLVKALSIVIVLGFMTWYAIHTKNWGKFDKTSMTVWGAVIGVILLVVIGMSVMLHSA